MSTSGKYVREYYGVTAKRGARVIVDGRPGVFCGFHEQYIRVRLDGEKRATSWHPTWHVEWPQEGAA